MNKSSKTIAYCGLAILLLCMAFYAYQRGNKPARARKALESAHAMFVRHTQLHAALGTRFGQVHIDRYLSPVRLASSTDVQEGRESITRLRALLVEQASLDSQVTAEEHAMVLALPERPLREKALKAEADAAPRNQALRERLSNVQVANLTAKDEIIQWAERNHALLHANGTELVVDDAEKLGELKRLQAALGATDAAGEAALTEAMAVPNPWTPIIDELRLYTYK